jgi:hypothetical protein
LRDPTRCPSVSNRKRIWKILDENEALFHLVLSGLQLAGEPVEKSEDSFPSSLTLQSHRFNPLRLVSGETLAGWKGPNALRQQSYLHFGYRELYVRSFQDPIGGSLCVGVGISVVSFNTQRYISGLRVYLASNTPDGGVTELSVGFVHASIETCIAVEEARPLLGFMVAVSPKGVKAMKPVVD